MVGKNTSLRKMSALKKLPHKGRAHSNCKVKPVCRLQREGTARDDPEQKKSLAWIIRTNLNDEGKRKVVWSWFGRVDITTL
jgi:hypothetical protein